MSQRLSFGPWLPVTLALALTACGASAKTSAGKADAASDVAADAAQVDVRSDACTCATTDTCCDGCKPKSDGKKCAPTGGTWGTCGGGSCSAVPGSVEEWSVGSGDGVGVHGLAAGSNQRVAVAWGDATSLTGSVSLWDAKAKQALWIQAGYAASVAMLPGDATLLVAGTTPAQLLALSDGTPQVTLMGTTGPVAAAPNGKQVAAATPTQIQVFTLGGQLLQGLDHAETAKASHHQVAFSPDSARVASATGQNGLGSPHGEVKVFTLQDSANPQTLSCTSMGAQFAPDSKRLLTACWNVLAIWDALTGKELVQGFEKDDVLSVAWSPDGKWIASGTLTMGAKLFEADKYTGNVAKPFALLPVSQVPALAFSPDSATLYVGSGSKPSVYAWTLPTTGK